MGELGVAPAVYAVTILAGLTELIEMYVVDFVAANALGWSLFEITAAMTLRAGYLLMTTLQRELSGAVVKPGLSPASSRMTILTLFPLTALVHIIFPVAVNAQGGGFTKGFVLDVALFATNGSMFVFEWKISKRMVKSLGA